MPLLRILNWIFGGQEVYKTFYCWKCGEGFDEEFAKYCPKCETYQCKRGHCYCHLGDEARRAVEYALRTYGYSRRKKRIRVKIFATPEEAEAYRLTLPYPHEYEVVYIPEWYGYVVRYK